MKTSRFLSTAVLTVILMGTTSVFSQDKMMKENKMAKDKKMMAMEPKMVGGATMYPTMDIVSNAVNSADHTTLVAAVKAAGLVETLQGSGPFTVFAPTNAAFDKLPMGTVETLLKPENKTKLQGVLTYHVLSRQIQCQGYREGHQKR